MTLTVVEFATAEVVGHLELGAKDMVGDTELTSSMAEAYMARVAYSQSSAVAYWNGWSNGYYFAEVR